MTTDPLTDEQFAELKDLVSRTTPVGAVTASPGLLNMLVAEVGRLRAELAEAAEDLTWLRCLEAAGVDNWEGIETAIEMRGE